MKLVLASASPRRRQILTWLGVEFEVVEPEADELAGGLEPEELVVENARRKARAGRAAAGEGAVVLGVDTDVFLGPEPLGKPADEAAAREHLEALAGRTHTVLSGLCLLGPHPDAERSGVERSLVTFAELTPELIDLYVRSGEWRGRAGAYAIQGLGSLLVDRVEGDFSNIVGLPIRLLLRLAPELARKP
ncbi:MAG TPA: Maf family protein [Solirubrobacterales bacterium]